MAKEVEREDDNDLVERLSGDHLDHISDEKSESIGVWFPVQ